MAGWVDSAIRYVGKEGGGVEVEFNELTRQFEISVPAGLHVWHDDSISGEGTEDNPLSLAWDVTLPTIPEEPFEATDTLIAVSADEIVKRISLTSVSTAILDEAAVATAAVVADLSGVTDPATARDTLNVYSKTAVDSLLASTAAGSGHRVHVRAATTANITIASALVAAATLDGVTLVADDLVLVKDQSTASQNGVYVVGSTPARYPLLDGWEELPGALVTVGEGDTNHDTLWLCTSDTGGTIDTSNVVFMKLTIAGELLASNNLSELASAATARTNLGLVIGTNVVGANGTTNTTTGAAIANTGATSVVPLTIKGVTSQGANLTEWLNPEGTGVLAVTAAGAIELGHAADTTIARAAAGVVTIEGQRIMTSVQPIAAQSTAPYTLAASDLGGLVERSYATAQTLTVPQDSDVTWPVGGWCEVYVSGAGQLTVQAGSGATLNVSGPTAKSAARYARLGLQKVAANTWLLTGYLAAS